MKKAIFISQSSQGSKNDTVARGFAFHMLIAMICTLVIEKMQSLLNYFLYLARNPSSLQIYHKINFKNKI